MAPGESSRLATTWTAAGAGSSLSVAMIVVGTPMPVMPQAPMRPRATSCSKAGRTASTKRRWGVPGLWSALASGTICLIVQEEEVHPLELQAGQTRVETPLQQWQDLAGCPVADGTLGRYAYACRQSAPKGLAEYHLGFATAIARGHIEKGDACLPGLLHGRDRLLAGGWPPDLTNTATTEGEGTDVTKFSKGSLLHE